MVEKNGPIPQRRHIHTDNSEHMSAKVQRVCICDKNLFSSSDLYYENTAGG